MDPKQFWLETNVRLKPQEIKVGTLLIAVKTFTTFMIILRIGSEDKGCDNHSDASDEMLLADGAPTVGRGRLFDGSTKFFYENC